MAITHNTSTKPPTQANPHGAELNAAASVVLVFMTLAVATRLWGRYRYSSLSSLRESSYGESRFWLLLSDITILISFVGTYPHSWQTLAPTNWRFSRSPTLA